MVLGLVLTALPVAIDEPPDAVPPALAVGAAGWSGWAEAAVVALGPGARLGVEVVEFDPAADGETAPWELSVVVVEPCVTWLAVGDRGMVTGMKTLASDSGEPLNCRAASITT